MRSEALKVISGGMGRGGEVRSPGWGTEWMFTQIGWCQRWLNMKGEKKTTCSTKWFLLVLWRTVNLWWFLIKTNIYLGWGKKSQMTNVKGLTIVTNITAARKATCFFFNCQLTPLLLFLRFVPMCSYVLFISSVITILLSLGENLWWIFSCHIK